MKKVEEFGILNFVIPYGIAAGYSLWTQKGMWLRSKFLSILEDHIKSIGEVIFNYTLGERPLIEYSTFYDEKFDDYNNVPIYRKNDLDNVFITDMLPYNLRLLSKSEQNVMMTNYSVIRLMKGKIEKLYTECLITICQINIKCEHKKIEETSHLLFQAIFNFFRDINLNIRFLEYPPQTNYSDKLGFFCGLNGSDTIEAIFQCCLMNKTLLHQFGIDSKYSFFDIGGSQRLFSVWYDNNSDNNGLYLPLKLREYDISYVRHRETKNNDYLNYMKALGMRYHTDYIDDNKKISYLRKNAYSMGAAVFLIHRSKNDTEFIEFHTRTGEKGMILTPQELQILFSKIQNVEDFFYHRADSVYLNKSENDGLRVREKRCSGIIKPNGFF